jgi:thiamine-phosphate pyrophosphorylase
MNDLPRLILIADRFTEAGRAECALQAIEAGVQWVHLRDHDASDAAFHEATVHLNERIARVDAHVRVSVNQRLNVARRLSLDYHEGTYGPGVDVARERLGPDAVIGFSAHEEKEVTGPQAARVDYFFFSPIFPTESKPGHPGTGIKTLSRICGVTEAPVFALGGITPPRVESCLHAGAHGIAVLSGIMDAKDPARAANAYLRAVASSGDR